MSGEPVVALTEIQRERYESELMEKQLSIKKRRVNRLEINEQLERLDQQDVTDNIRINELKSKLGIGKVDYNG